MDYVTITAHFDDIDQAERAATSIKNKVKNVISVSLRSKRAKNAYDSEGGRNAIASDYFLTTNTLANPTISSTSMGFPGNSVGFPMAYPVGVPHEFDGIENSYKKTKLTAKIPLDQEGLASSIILSHSGHFISY